MITFESRVFVEHVTGRELTDFLLDCTDDAYNRWWPGVHLRMHVVRPGRPDHVGDLIFIDEFVGRRHLKATAEVVEAVPGTRIVWQVCRGVRLPIRLFLDLEDDTGGVALRHRIDAGFSGPGRLCDPLFSIYFGAGFATAMDTHVGTEFNLLRDQLRAAGPDHGPDSPTTAL
ncbi:MAG: hypothetical protein QG622_3219 [Actinomycetota bacterium]|nr:hypothetical protein [Actinomycetota bacterium]